MVQAPLQDAAAMKDRELQLAQEQIDELETREAELKQRDHASTEERMRLLGVIETQNRLLAVPSSVSKVATPAKPKTISVSKPEPTAKTKVTAALTKLTTARKQPMAASKPGTRKEATLAKPKSPTKVKGHPP